MLHMRCDKLSGIRQEVVQMGPHDPTYLWQRIHCLNNQPCNKAKASSAGLTRHGKKCGLRNVQCHATFQRVEKCLCSRQFRRRVRSFLSLLLFQGFLNKRLESLVYCSWKCGVASCKGFQHNPS